MNTLKSSPRPSFLFLILILFSGGASSPVSAAENAVRVNRGAPTNSATSNPAPQSAAPKVELPPAPEGVTDLRFDEIFKMPVGPKGLELTDKLRSLDGKRVRMLGYMVKQANPSPWKILLSPVPRITREREYGHADDLPPNVVHVFLPRDPHPIRPHTPGLLLLTGRFEVGNREEADERVSLFRLHLDPPENKVGMTAAPAKSSAVATADK